MRTSSTIMRAAVGTAFTDRLGWIATAPFLSDMRYITSTGITTTTHYRTSNAWNGQNIEDCTTTKAVIFDGGTRNGEARSKGNQSSEQRPIRCSQTRLRGNARADIVALLSLRDILCKSFALTSALNRSLTRLAKFAASNLGLRRIVAVGRCVEKTPVYNLTVADAHLFYANGVLSSNTEGEDHAADSVRYACSSRPYTAPLPAEMESPKDRYARKWRPSGSRGKGSPWAA